MNLLTRYMTIPGRKLLAVTFLFSSSFAWFFVFYRYFDELVAPGSLDTVWHNTGILLLLVFNAISALMGSIIAGKTNRRRLLFL